jgi:hypothetical protein
MGAQAFAAAQLGMQLSARITERYLEPPNDSPASSYDRSGVVRRARPTVHHTKCGNTTFSGKHRGADVARPPGRR